MIGKVIDCCIPNKQQTAAQRAGRNAVRVRVGQYELVAETVEMAASYKEKERSNQASNKFIVNDPQMAHLIVDSRQLTASDAASHSLQHNIFAAQLDAKHNWFALHRTGSLLE